MTCPNCGAPIADPEGAFCSRCGAPLGSEETEATEKIDVPPLAADGSRTTEIDHDDLEKASATGSDTVRPAAPSTEPAQSQDSGPLLSDYASAVRRKVASSWLDPLGAACLAFLVLLSLGAVLLVAAKLQFSGFGAGANPIEILSAITILGLSILRVPVHVDDLVISVLPLGALIAAGLGIVWATSVTFRGKSAAGLWAGASVGIPFGIICWIAALVFRFDGKSPVFSGAWGSLFWGLAWGGLFGALGALRARGAGRKLTAVVAEAADGSTFRRGATAAGLALSTASVLAGAATLLWIIVALLRGAPGPRFGFGDAVAAFVYLAAFAPNVIVSLTALGMGAPVYVGARVTVAGAGVGQIDRVWLFGDAPGYAWLLILIPLIACSLAGFWARRASKNDEVFPVLGAFAGVFAVTLGLLAWLGEARLGAALLGRGLARLDVNALATLFFAFAWAALAGLGGWSLADRGASEEKAARDDGGTG